MRMFHLVARENWSLLIILLAKMSRTFTLGKNSGQVSARVRLLSDCGVSCGVSKIARGMFSVLLLVFA